MSARRRLRTTRRRWSLTAVAFAVLVFSIGIAQPSAAQLPFFPGAEGFGGTFSGTAPAAGWFSNATIYRVTNLNDSGPGSFRNAFQENTSNRIIVFDVAGTIHLTSDNVDIKNLSNYYIAGQTAPGPVTIYGDSVQLTHSSGKENRNVVLRYLTFRKGISDNDDAITFAGGGLGTNMILDHVSASWSEDEVLSVANNNTNVTVQYSTIHDALVENHAYGSLIRPRIDSHVTFHHNLYAHNASRQARFGTYNGETLTVDFRNNVIYNWRDRASYAGGSSEPEQEYVDVNYVGNYLIAGPGTTGSTTRAFSVDRNVDVRAWQSGNFIDSDRSLNPAGQPNGVNTGWAMFGYGSGSDQTLVQMPAAFTMAPVATQSAGDAYWQIIDHVGNWWWDRDAIDSRVINNVLANTGPPIGAAAPNAAELTALLTTPMTTHPAGWDSDSDGMPNWWEEMHGLNPNSSAGTPDWKLDFDADGYINLIEYINERGEFPAPTPIVFHGAASNRYAQIMNWKTDDGGVTTGMNWQPSRFDTAVVRSGTTVVDAVGQHAGSLLIAPNAGDSATLNVTAGWIDVAETLDVGAAGAGVVNHSGGTVVADQVILGGASGTSGAYALSGSGRLRAGLLGKGASGGSFTFTGGELAAGLVAFSLVNEGGVIAPGDGLGQMQIMGDLTMQAGIIRLDVGGATSGSFDRLVIDGALQAGGTLEVNLLGGFTPQLGDAFDLLDFAGASGNFALSLPALGNGLAWDASNLLTTGALAVVDPSLQLADFNDDGFVDGADLALWKSGFGASGQTNNSQGDANGSGVVDGADFLVWQRQFSNGGVTAQFPTPEPSAQLLTALAAAAAALLAMSQESTLMPGGAISRRVGC